MKVLSIEFTPAWSWGLIFEQMRKHTDIEFSRVFISNGDKINFEGYDMILSQNITLLKRFKERLLTVCRLGGNQNFDNMDAIAPVLQEMAKCFCLVATNNKLYEIAKSVNDNVYLIPNGIDLDEWTPVAADPERPFSAGFCGNISNPRYREYKGYDFVSQACRKARIPLKTALYQDNQIAHSEMRQLFYGVIDCIVHPTLGEGCSNTLMEAAACGIPIVATKCAGFHGEMMVDGENVLFCERSSESIQEKIELLKNDASLRQQLSIGARAFAEKHHNVKEIVKQYEVIFNDCVNKAKERAMNIKFFGIIHNSQNATATYKIDNGKVQVKTFPASYTREQIEAEIRQSVPAATPPDPVLPANPPEPPKQEPPKDIMLDPQRCVIVHPAKGQCLFGRMHEGPCEFLQPPDSPVPAALPSFDITNTAKPGKDKAKGKGKAK